MTVLTALWRRLDTPGHDACRFWRDPAGWHLEGAAVFATDGGPAMLRYRVDCNTDARTRSGRVDGHVAGRDVDVSIERDGEVWRLDGAVVPGLTGCDHLDYGFTPATNFFQTQQIALAVGAAAEVPVAWLDVPPAPLVRLPQRYERRTDTTYDYVATTVGYAGLLELTRDGVVRRYPDLWELEH